MSPRKLLALFLLTILLLFVVTLINLNLPTDTHASPLAGFTPTPVPDQPDDDDNDGGSGSGPSPDIPIDYVLVRVDQCDLSCADNVASNHQQTSYPLLASAAPTGFALPLEPALAAPLPEILVPVELVHQGSGWIATETLSTHHPNRIPVPYPGFWEVFLVASPQFMTAEAIDATGTNLAELHSALAQGPQLLGLVQANTQDPQLIRCPIQCVIEPAAVPQEIPFLLPETGASNDLSPITAVIIIVLSLAGFTCFAYCLMHFGPLEK